MTTTTHPAWGYKIEDGKVASKIFADGKLPRGWKDTPAGMAEEIAAEAEAEKARMDADVAARFAAEFATTKAEK